MATATKTWVFATGAESLADGANSSSITFAYLGSDGTPSSGCVRFTTTSKGLLNAVEWGQKATTGETFETWGVPVASTVTAVRISSWSEKTAAATKLTGCLVTVDIIGSDGTGLVNVCTGVDCGSTLDSSWNSLAATSSVTGLSLASTTDVRLRISIDITTSSGSGTASVDQRFDSIALEMTYTANAQSLAPAVLGAASGTVDPTLSPGAVTLTPTVAGAASGTVNPTLNPGAVTITPDTAGATLGCINPTIATSAGSQLLEPTVAGVASGTVDPTMAPGAATMTPTVAGASSGTLDPTASPGAVSMEPGAAAAASGTVDPEIESLPPAQDLTPDVAAVASAGIAPIMAPGAATIAPDSAQVASEAIAADMVPGPASMTPTAASVASGLDAALAPGPVSLTPDVAEVASGLDAALAPGAVTLEPTAAEVASGTDWSMLGSGVQWITPDPAEALSIAWEPYLYRVDRAPVSLECLTGDGIVDDPFDSVLAFLGGAALDVECGDLTVDISLGGDAPALVEMGEEA